ncbi:MAG: uroporphyrinogen decarboxylase [Myxococcales bacterium]|nr:uroporphyrinogen decarboxylase [Myxococcales bacterium]
MTSRDLHRDSLFIRSCYREPVERTPVWVMRQAGRYLPEYREVRAKSSFLELCKTPELAAEVTMQPIRRFGLDAAIIFSDILVPVEAMGIPLDFNPGPILSKKVSTAEDVAQLKLPDPLTDMSYVPGAIRAFTSAMPEVPLIGFAGAPFTLAAYVIEGGGSKNFAETKKFLFQQPKVARELLAKLTDTVSAHLWAQVDAGCCAVQIFDSWAGQLSRDDYMDFALPYTIEIIERLKVKNVPVILFAKGVHACLPELARTGAHVLGIDWTLPLDVAVARTEGKVALQGNLDPCELLGPVERIERQVQRVLTEAKDAPGHIFNLGHGILPMTSPDHMGAFVEAVKRLGIRRGAPATEEAVR